MGERRTKWQRLLPNIVKDDEGIAGLPAGPVIYRTRVHGGWLVSTGKGEGAGLAFVPDQDGDWES